MIKLNELVTPKIGKLLLKYGYNWFLVRLKYETYVCTNCGDKTKWLVSEQKLKKVSLKEIQEAYG